MDGCQVDGVLLSHPAVAEAVSFGVPNEKYGEIVAAAVVLKPGVAEEGIEAAIKWVGGLVAVGHGGVWSDSSERS